MTVVPFDVEVEKLFIRGKVDFYRLVRIEMVMMGYDPNDPADVAEFWEEVNLAFLGLTNQPPKQPDW